jgi:PD-(D/E)XK nuclease superfamily
MITRQNLDAYYASIGSTMAIKSAGLQSELDSFYSLLRAKLSIHEEASRRIAIFNAPDFTPFNYFWLDENAFSKVVAGLLDADGTHGQADLFLGEFLTVLKLGSPKTRRRCKVLTQVPVFASSMLGFLDILIDFGDFGIGIENKPWAGEQIKQVERYCIALDQRYSGEFQLVYLSADGRRPASISEELRKRLEADKKLTTLSYGHLQRWLRHCARMCEADKVRWFLRDFAQYLAEEFAEQDVDHEVE